MEESKYEEILNDKIFNGLICLMCKVNILDPSCNKLVDDWYFGKLLKEFLDIPMGTLVYITNVNDIFKFICTNPDNLELLEEHQKLFWNEYLPETKMSVIEITIKDIIYGINEINF